MVINPYIHTEEIHNTKSAYEVLPLVINWVKPASILDIGCGTGTWLNVAKELGVSKVLGLDTPFVNKELMLISNEEFVPTDLSKPFHINQKFDMAICLEVAEHLHEKTTTAFIKSVTNHTDVVLFSAAIPGQGGQNHINEQWPNYWANLFKAVGFDAHDILRNKIWDNANIHWWYRQNIVIYAKKGNPFSEELGPATDVKSLVHPALFTPVVERSKYLESPMGIRTSLKKLNNALKNRRL